ncbi:hypothetical protein IQ273_14810 [Nodosilinea sp. LEGE 07298]|jgi:hypothetical protein|uniref:hypothetical protein n=1 Tax=Nodosilinea sp. LEGE 07298 TaxID=2777970 RepID=UPI00188098E8|nr:hypothetical protein [Nodosilinea sp. LEGE 07298]MBE9110689.1 hypothetical protein [Nodosilinea sp. LEGE 07298]
MERGLLWLPLLAVFIGLAWAGWHEYQKVQAYEAWAAEFDRSKYDIKAMLGQQGDDLTWGRPTRQGPIDLTTLSLQAITSLRLEINGQPVTNEAQPAKGKIELALATASGETYRIPFTDSDLALRWEKALHQSLQALKSASA